MAKSNTVARVIGVVAAVAVVGIFLAGSREKREDQPATAPESASVFLPANPGPADVIALLDGLHVGDDVSGWKVYSIEAPQDRIVQVIFRQENSAFSVGVVRKGVSKAPPPITLEAYEIGYGMGRGQLSGDAMSTVAQAVADRVRKTEKVVPVPAGM